MKRISELLEEELKAWHPTNAEIIMGALYSLASMVNVSQAPSELVDEVLDDCSISLAKGKKLWTNEVHMTRSDCLGEK